MMAKSHTSQRLHFDDFIAVKGLADHRDNRNRGVQGGMKMQVENGIQWSKRSEDVYRYFRRDFHDFDGEVAFNAI